MRTAEWVSRREEEVAVEEGGEEEEAEEEADFAPVRYGRTTSAEWWQSSPLLIDGTPSGAVKNVGGGSCFVVSWWKEGGNGSANAFMQWGIGRTVEEAMKQERRGRRPSVMAVVVLGLTIKMGSMLGEGRSGRDGSLFGVGERSERDAGVATEWFVRRELEGEAREDEKEKKVRLSRSLTFDLTFEQK
jgi:hypothetical protein